MCSFGQLECDQPGTVDHIGRVIWDTEACGFYVNGITLEAFCVDYIINNIHDVLKE